MDSSGNNRARRKNLLELMSKLAAGSRDCRSCTGVCCTFVGNSMLITPLEAWDLYQFLIGVDRWNSKLKLALEQTIQDFRLDRPPPGDGRRTFARRRYTCPFFKGQSLGCSIAPASKPYGCLAFNPIGTQVADGENCRSYTEALQDRETAHAPESSENRDLCHTYGFHWEKLSIPEALLEVSQVKPFQTSS